MKEHSAIERYISQMEDYELYEKVDNVMDLYGYKPENLIQILHAAQTIFGCVPLELQRFIADSLDITLSEVSGVVSFYSFFSVTPRGNIRSVSVWEPPATSEAARGSSTTC